MFIKLTTIMNGIKRTLGYKPPGEHLKGAGRAFLEGFKDGEWVAELRRKCGLPVVLREPSEQIKRSARAALFFEDEKDEDERFYICSKGVINK